MIVTRGKIYERCALCGQVVRINKPIFGGQHFCLLPEEREARRKSGIEFPPLDNATREG